MKEEKIESMLSEIAEKIENRDQLLIMLTKEISSLKMSMNSNFETIKKEMKK